MVRYDQNLFPGEVLRVVGNETEVKVMHKFGNFWRWPPSEEPDILFYTQDQGVRKISVPQVAGSRGQFKFDEI